MTRKKRTSLDVISIQPETPMEEAPIQIAEKAPPTRSRSIQQTVYLPPAVHEQLRRLAFEERAKMHDYLMEGLDLVFKNRGLPSIEELKKQEE